MSAPLWHLLQISDVLDLELASALAECVPLIAWEPQRTLLPTRTPPGSEAERWSDASGEGHAAHAAGAFRIRSLPLLRGFARPPVRWVGRTDATVLQRLLAQTEDPEASPLICTTPFFAGVAERWPGPVVYWLTDLIAEYPSAHRADVHRLDRRMCRAATLLCPNSRRLQQYLVETAACDPGKICVVPNATRAANLLPCLPEGPGLLPHDLRQTLQRPFAGVIGNLAGNMDWLLLRELVERTPWLTWLFVGPVTMPISDPEARQARAAVMQYPNSTFVGRKPYGELAAYARSFDVAVLPYRRCEPTYSGSSTRFYEHLVACRPMLATRGLEELTHKTPLLALFDTADEGVQQLERLRTLHFDDGLCSVRWHASREATWQTRARTMQDELAARLRQRAGAHAAQTFAHGV